jgi:dTDP-4-dehydrorhamnose 3,5-epimerase
MLWVPEKRCPNKLQCLKCGEESNTPVEMTVRLFTPARIQDPRGWFAESWRRDRFEELGLDADFCQDNHSFSAQSGTLRGLHFQRSPFVQAKLVRCIRGRIYDVAVDIRSASPSFGQWVGCELSADAGNQLFIPEGYAHGFLTLEDNCEVAYKVSAYYSPEADAGIAWDDPDLAILWPVGALTLNMSDKDKNQPLLREMKIALPYDGQPLVAL